MKDDNDFPIRFLLLIELASFVYICVILYTEHLSIEFIGLAGLVFLLIFVYSIIRYRQIKKLRGQIARMTESLHSLFIDKEDPSVLYLDNTDELKPFFMELAKIKEHNRTIENDRQRILGIVNSVATNMEMEKLLENLMPKLIDVTKSNCGVFYLANTATSKLEIKHSVGFSKNIYSDFDLALGEGFIGIAAQNQEIKIINDIPEDTNYIIRTFLGKIKPKSIMVVPIVNQEQLVGLFAFASIYEYSKSQLEMVDLIKYYVGAAVSNGLTYEKTKRLTNELKFQNRLIQNLNDDLERKVQDRTLFLNDILNSIKDYAIYAIDKDGIVLVWNQGAEILFGYTAKEVIGKPIETVYTAEEIEAGDIRNRIEHATQDGKFVENGWRYRRDGAMYYVEMVLFARYDQHNEIIGFTNVTKDITTLKNIEGALWFEKKFSSRLIESSSRAIILTDQYGIITLANNMASQLLQTDKVNGQSICDFFEEKEALAENIAYLADADMRGEWNYKLKSGNYVHLNVSSLENDTDASKVLFFHLWRR